MQLAASVAANGDQCPSIDIGEMLAAPGFAQDYIDERGTRMHEILNGILGQKTGFQLFVSLAQVVAIGSGRAVGVR